MKEFFTDFLTILANSIMVICFAFMSFLLLANFFHYKEVNYSYTTDLKDNIKYQEYNKILKNVNKKMNSVDYKDPSYSTTAKPIHAYYEACVSSLKKGTFTKLADKSGVTALDVYNANNEILKDYNSSCIFTIPYNISNIYGLKTVNKTFVPVKKITDQKADIIIDNAEYLTDSGLGNSSYSFVTDVTRSTIYNKVSNELDLTIDNYRMIAYLLDDVANWYVSEYGGNG